MEPVNNVLELHRITKRFGPRTIFENLDLSVRPGERFFILGPSGCGKTTLLRVIAGLDGDHGGRVTINGRTVAGNGIFLPPHKRAVGFVFQDGALWPHLTVEKHLTYAVSSKKNKAWLDHLLDLTGLTSRRKDHPTALSGGERQRLSLARALSNRPAILLLDEPLGHLDRNTALELRVAVQEIVEKAGTTSIFVTHDQEEALSMAHRVLLMGEEGPVQTGAPEEIFQKPSTPWAAAFFGPVNRFSVTCGPGGEGATPLGSFQTGLAAGASCEIMVRANQVEAAWSGPGIPGRVKKRLYQGSAFLLLCEVSGTPVTAFCRNPGKEGEETVYLKVIGTPMVFPPMGEKT